MREITIPSTPQESSWQYNGFDCCLTLQLFNILEKEIHQAPPNVLRTYQQSLFRLAPAMEMSLRGIKVDQKKLISSRAKLRDDLVNLENNFNRLCLEVVGRRIQATSWQQVAGLLYVDFGIRGQGTGREKLERIAASNFFARPFIKFILAIRDTRKQISLLSTTLSEDGRLKYNLNVAGTSTGRNSCRESVFGIGTNSQNIDSRHRGIFRADPYKILVEVDLEQADSRNVGAICYSLFGKSAYLDACEAGDLHTSVALMVWGDVNPLEVYRHNTTYRQFAKICGHGTNYMASPRGVSLSTGIPVNLIKPFQEDYFSRFPEIREWHKWTGTQLRQSGCITTLFGRRRYFHDRTWDDSIIKEAAAYQGQSMTAEEIDLGFSAIWRAFPWVELLTQVHDSILFQLPEDKLDVLPEILETMKVNLTIRDREFTVPLEAKYGKYWGKGMTTWTG